MGIFGALFETLKLSVSIVKDVTTLAGVCTGEKESYTAQQIDKIEKEIKK